MNSLLASVLAFVDDAAITLDAYMGTVLWAILGPGLLISVGLGILRYRDYYFGTPWFVRFLPLAQRTLVAIMALTILLWMASGLWVDHLNAVAGYNTAPWRNAGSIIALGILLLVGTAGSLVPGEAGSRAKALAA